MNNKTPKILVKKKLEIKVALVIQALIMKKMIANRQLRRVKSNYYPQVMMMMITLKVMTIEKLRLQLSAKQLMSNSRSLKNIKKAIIIQANNSCIKRKENIDFQHNPQ